MSAQIISFQNQQFKSVKKYNTNPDEGNSTLREILLNVADRVDETMQDINNEISPHLLADLRGVSLLLRAIGDA